MKNHIDFTVFDNEFYRVILLEYSEKVKLVRLLSFKTKSFVILSLNKITSFRKEFVYAQAFCSSINYYIP